MPSLIFSVKNLFNYTINKIKSLFAFFYGTIPNIELATAKNFETYSNDVKFEFDIND